jgi:hypothetical protein
MEKITDLSTLPFFHIFKEKIDEILPNCIIEAKLKDSGDLYYLSILSKNRRAYWEFEKESDLSKASKFIIDIFKRQVESGEMY